MAVYPLYASFARGELTPKLHGRVDIEHYGTALATATNWMVMRQGGICRRPGFRFVHPLRDESAAGCLLEFEFSEEQAYALCFNGGKIRFFTLGGIVTQSAQAITGITQANPAVVTYTGSDTYANGDRVKIVSVVGMTEINNREFAVANVNAGANTFELSGVNATGYGAYVSGGTVAEIYEIDHPYGAGDLAELQISQAGDTIYIAHRDFAQRKLVRNTEVNWVLSVIEFEDGPWLDEDTQGTYLTPADTGNPVPDMSDNTTPSGTAADSTGSADAFRVFDRSATGLDIAGTDGWVSYDFAGAATKIVDAYWLSAANLNPDRMVTHWTFEGYNGASWIILDTRDGETTWITGEKRYFEFPNETAYEGYRLNWTAVDGSTTNSRIGDIIMHEAGDSQTPFDLVASSIVGINGGIGFVATDAGRTVRLLGGDGRWRWARIVARTSSTVVTIRLYQHALRVADRMGRWQLSSWSVHDGYPRAVGFYDDRLVWAGSTREPRKVWASQSSDYEDHGLSTPPQDNDGINAAITGGNFSEIMFIEEMTDFAIATGSEMRAIGPAANTEPFSSLNIRQGKSAAIGAAPIQALTIDATAIFVSRYRKRLYEYGYDQLAGGFTARDLSILSEHLLKTGVTECAFQDEDDQDNFCWFVLSGGHYALLNYDQAQKVAGFTRIVVAGGGGDDAEVGSCAAIPSDGGSVLYGIHQRTINGQTRRYVEYLTPRYESEVGEDLADAVYFDSAGVYDAGAASVITGVNWLIGETVGILADGVDVGDAVVAADGDLTLPASVAAASTWVFGKRYTSRAVTLRAPQAGNKDGAHLGRKKVVSRVYADMLDTAGLEAGTLESTRPIPHESEAAAAGSLNTGIFEVTTIDKHRNNGVVVLTTDRGYPAMVRALITMLDGEP